MTNRPDFRAIKARVSIVDVLWKYGIEMRSMNQYELRGGCPLPTHTSKTKEFTFVVNPKKNVWSCHSASCVEGRNQSNGEGKLKKGGDLIEFVKFMENCSLREAGVHLEKWFGEQTDSLSSGAPSEKETPASDADGEGVNLPLKFELKDIEFNHPYLRARGFDEEECEYLGVGFFPGKGIMKNRVVFPLHNGEGELIGYAGRRVEYSLFDENPEHIAPETADLERWKFPPGFKRGQVIYNLHRVEGDEAILVESFWGVMACIRAGIMNAVAIMSNNITEHQADLMQSRFRRVTVMLDGDEAGRDGIGQVVGKLVMAEVDSIDLVLLPKGEQPDSISSDDLRKYLRIADMPSAWSVVEEAPIEAS
jgi:DNA primase